MGDEFYVHFDSPETGLHPAQWLGALVKTTGAALRAGLAEDAGDWQQLWALLRGLGLATPQMLGDAQSEAIRVVRDQFPDIKDPQEIALAELGQAGELLAERGLAVGGGLAGGWRPGPGSPLVARDVYGCRFLLVAPFALDEDAPDHWYAWDVDLCWITAVVGAGVFSSAEDALLEWRQAVGPAASGAMLSPCQAGMPPLLLAPALATGVLSDMLEGSEPRELIREYYRLRRRAQDLTGSDAGEKSESFGTDDAYDEFTAWYTTRHDDAPKPAAPDLILNEWGPGRYPDERSFYACSPHRIEIAARLIRDKYFPDDANAALELLPEWTLWCLERSGLDGDAAARSRAAARAAVAVLVGGEDGGHPTSITTYLTGTNYEKTLFAG